MNMTNKHKKGISKGLKSYWNNLSEEEKETRMHPLKEYHRIAKQTYQICKEMGSLL